MQFVTAKNVQPRSYYAALVYGPTGIGKTTLSLSAPAPGIIDFDGGIPRVNASFTSEALIAQIDAWEGYNAMVQQIGEVPCESLIFDTVGKMINMIQAYVMSQPKYAALKKPSLPVWGEIKQELSGFIKGIKLCRKNLIFVAQEVETTITTPRGDVRYRIPACGSDKQRTELLQDLDLVGYMYKAGDQTCITFDPTEAYYGKNTCGLPGEIKIGYLQGSYENKFFALIAAKFRQNQQANIDNADYYKQVNELVEEAYCINSADDANAFVAKMKSTEFLLDAKTKVIAAFNGRVQALNLTKKGSTYE